MHQFIVCLIIAALTSGCTSDPMSGTSLASPPPGKIAEYKIDRWRTPLLIPVTWEGKTLRSDHACDL